MNERCSCFPSFFLLCRSVLSIQVDQLKSKNKRILLVQYPSVLILISICLVSNNHPRRIGSVADIDPANGVYGSVDPNAYHLQQQQQLALQQMRLAQQQQQQSLHHQQQQPQHHPNHQSQIASQKSMQKSISTKVVSQNQNY